jgi:sugar lactone lactonase YvrE
MAALRDIYQAANKLGEAPIWHAASKRLLWIDLYDPKLFIHDPAKGETVVREIALKAPLGAIAATTNSKLLIVSHAGGLSTLNIKTGASKIFARPEQDRDGIIYNDCKTDRSGRLWVGSSHAKETDPRGALWCVLPNGKCFLGDVGFAVSNGPAFSLDGKIMYFNDSVGKKTFAYDISPDDPMPRNRRVLISYTPEEGMPDGLTVDAGGNLWVAHWGGARVTQFSNAGFRLRHIQVPAPHVTSAGFGGENLATLYVTTARDGMSPDALHLWPQSGNLFATKPGVEGVAEPLFALKKG